MLQDRRVSLDDGCHLVEVLYCQDCDDIEADFNCLKVGYPSLSNDGTDDCGEVAPLIREVND